VWEGDNGDGRDDVMWVNHGPRAVWEEDIGDGRDDGCWVSHGPVRQRCGKETMVMVEMMGAG